MKFAFWGPTTKPPDGMTHVESYRRQLDEIVQAEDYGFDHYWFFEHHISPSSPSPSPNLMIAAASRLTRRMRLGALVNILPYRHPLLVAEEMAMLDTLTEGRVDCGIGRGLKPYEFRAFGQDQEKSREMFTECLEVMRRIWADENFSHKGKYYTVEKNTPLSPPLVQKPHPPLYVSAQSPESVRWAASQDLPFGQIDALVEESKKDQKTYRDIQVAHGFAPVPRLFVTREVFVASTDEEARREAKPYLIRNWDLWNRYTQFSVSGQMPDSYDLWRKRAPMLHALTYEQIIEHGMILVGTPDTVVRTILAQLDELDIAMMVLGFRFGSMPYDLARRSMHLFATEVMPELRRREAARSTPAPSRVRVTQD